MEHVREQLTSRRAVLAGMFGALAGVAAQAVARPLPVAAADLVLETENDAAGTTTIRAADGIALKGVGLSHRGVGLEGHASNAAGGVGVRGTAKIGIGVFGSTEEGESSAVFGNAPSPTGETYGLGGQVASPEGIGAMAWNIANGLAIAGHSGDTDTTVTPVMRTGVLGIASQDTPDARGVIGRTRRGQGVRGEATEPTGKGVGVFGTAISPDGYGVFSKGRLGTSSSVELKTVSTPPRPPAGRAYLFARTQGGTTQLCVRFPSGVVRVLASG